MSTHVRSSMFYNSHDKLCTEVIKLEYSLKLKIKRNDWLLADTCPQATNHCALFNFHIFISGAVEDRLPQFKLRIDVSQGMAQI